MTLYRKSINYVAMLSPRTALILLFEIRICEFLSNKHRAGEIIIYFCAYCSYRASGNAMKYLLKDHLKNRNFPTRNLSCRIKPLFLPLQESVSGGEFSKLCENQKFDYNFYSKMSFQPPLQPPLSLYMKDFCVKNFRRIYGSLRFQF